jgi:glucosamine--fructose-6-phosphate aminotransferase (isomerizing)
MTKPRLLRDIESQPESLERVLHFHSGEGREALKRAASLIRSARRVIVTGMGASLYAAMPLYYRLAAAGLDAAIVESAELLHYLRGKCRDAVVIAVSRSGETVEIVKLLPELEGLGARLVGVTNEPGSALARSAECTIIAGSLLDEMVAIQSYTGALLALYLLGAEIAGDPGKAQEEAARPIASLAEHISRNVQAISQWDEFLDPGAPVQLLARGPSYASACEGSLLFSETAKAAAFAMPAGSFRHGVVEQVDGRFQGLIFAAGRTRPLDLALAQAIQGFGGRVRVIGVPGEDVADLPLIAIPDADPYLAPILEIVPVQVAALRFAGRRGFAPGVFRYVQQVTSDEIGF